MSSSLLSLKSLLELFLLTCGLGSTSLSYMTVCSTVGCSFARRVCIGFTQKWTLAHHFFGVQVKFIQIQGVEIRHWGDAREPSRWNRGFLPNVCPLKQIVGIQRPWLPTAVSRIMLSQQVGWPEFQTRWIPSGTEIWQWKIQRDDRYTLPRWGFGVLVVRHRQRDPHRWIARRGRGQCSTTSLQNWVIKRLWTVFSKIV